MLGGTKVAFGGFSEKPIKITKGSTDPESLPLSHTW